MIEIIKATADQMPCIPEIDSLIVEDREPITGELTLAVAESGKYSFGRFKGWRIYKDGLTLYPTPHDKHDEPWTTPLKDLATLRTVIGIMWSTPQKGDLVYKEDE